MATVDAGYLHGQQGQWAAIRDAALDRYQHEEGYRYVDSAGKAHDTRSLGALAHATRRERKSCGAMWPEDRGR